MKEVLFFVLLIHLEFLFSASHKPCIQYLMRTVSSSRMRIESNEGVSITGTRLLYK